MENTPKVDLGKDTRKEILAALKGIRLQISQAKVRENTHFATADLLDHPLFDTQRARFEAVRPVLAEMGIRPAAWHAAIQRGAAARPGGVVRRRPARPPALRSRACAAGHHPPAPAGQALTSRIVAVKGVRPGEGVSYGMRFTADTPRRIAVVPAGYADGLDLRRAGRGAVLIRGRRAPIVGAVCMAMLMADVTGHDVVPGDDVVIIGAQGDQRIDVGEMAAAVGTIPYELLCRVGTRIERGYE